MRVLFYGNQGNIGLRITRWLRARGIDAVLFLQNNYHNSRSKPEWEDPSLLRNYPSWIRKFNRRFYNRMLPEWQVLKEGNKRDIVITTGSYVINALVLNKPVVYIPVGSDLTQLPFSTASLRAEFASYIYRRRIKKVDRILTVQDDCVWATRFLGVHDKLVPYPLPVDVEGIRARVDRELLVNLEKQYSKFDWVFLNPSRKNLDPNRVDYKGSEKFLQAFGELIRNNPDLNIKLVLGMHGLQTVEFQNNIEQLELTKYCDFVGHLSLPQLHAYMSLSNVVVFDQFINFRSHNLGGIQREALSLGAITVTATDVNASDFVANFGPGCPILTAFQTEDIVKVMQQIIKFSYEKRQSIHTASQLWAYKYLHWENRIGELIGILEEVIQDSRKG